MTVRTLAYVGIVAVFVAATGAAEDKPEDLAQAAAEPWLKLVDDANYDASWDEAAKLFQGAVTKEQWRQAAAGLRTPLGKLVSRKVKSRQYAEQLPVLPTESTW